MRQYLDLVRDVLDNGARRVDRTGTGTISVFGRQVRYDLRDGFPLVTTKRLRFKSVVAELLWFLRGETNIHTLDCGIWDAWADTAGELGPIYGAMWRRWGGTHDQVAAVLDELQRNPWSRRLIVSAWNVSELERMALPPCHVLWQLYADPAGGWLDLQLYQRSADLGLGVPFNVASYALLLSMIAGWAGLRPRFFVHTLGDAHVYLDHVDALRGQLEREPYPLPRLLLPTGRHPLEYEAGDIQLAGYQCHPPIRLEVSV